MSGVPGRKARVLVSPDDISYTAVAGIKQIQHTLAGTMVDDSEFSVDYVQHLRGLLDGKVSLSGNRRLADTNGQNAILSAMINDTALYFKVLPDNGTTSNVGFKQACKVSKFAQSVAIDGAVDIAIDLEGSGAITLV